jgi:hypothetical protein
VAFLRFRSARADGERFNNRARAASLTKLITIVRTVRPR